MFADKRCSILKVTHCMDDPLLSIYNFKFNESFILLFKPKIPNLRWMIHCCTSIVSNLSKIRFLQEVKNLNLRWSTTEHL